MKKTVALLSLIALLALSLVSCSLGGETTKITVGYMSGPTGMGMAKLIHDNGGAEGNESYAFNTYTDTAKAKADLTAGNVDIICLPTNEAAAYFNTVDNNTVVLAINCLNSLYLISDSSSNVTALSELEGKTVYTCKNGTPRVILEYLVEALELDITVSYTFDGKEMVAPKDVQTNVLAGKLPYAVIPEPLVTACVLGTAKTENPYSSDVDLGDEWKKVNPDSPVAMGCILAKKSFVEENTAAVKSFLEEYKASVEYIGNSANLDSAATHNAETGIMAAAPAAKKALSNLGDAIAYIDGKRMKSVLEDFYAVIGIKAPSDEFYYSN